MLQEKTSRVILTRKDQVVQFIKRIMLHPLGIYTKDERLLWRSYRPPFASMTIEGAKYSAETYRFERKHNGLAYEYRAIPLTDDEIDERRAW
jgi:hypothetical protein